MVSALLASSVGRAAGPEPPDHEAAAHWLDRDLLAWPLDPAPPAGTATFELHVQPDPPGGPVETHRLEPRGRFGAEEAAALGRPELAGATRLGPTGGPLDVRSLVRGRLVISVSGREGLLARTGVQTAAILDRTFIPAGRTFGPAFTGDPDRRVPRLALWAPTARTVSVVLFGEGGATEIHPMALEPDGTWVVGPEPSWSDREYLYEVEVFLRREGRIGRHRVTDPWSTGLTANGERSRLVDLQDPRWMPPGWPALRPPVTASPVDAAVYELHVRDFSWSDPSVPEPLRGTYRAFSLTGTRGTDHLRGLAAAGLTHVHLLPVFDVATIEERRAHQAVPDIPAAPAPASEIPQERIGAIRQRDGFNWGYDPHHYGVPEGSYATDPDGPTRTRELRELVASLAAMGLGVVLDVVYNHTHEAGTGPRSVLDRIVPDYYYRLDGKGNIQSTSCCPDTASEHRMMERLMIDTLLRWARDYKVVGFRFDLMGHHTRSNLERIRAALATLEPDTDGIDGSRILLYGEGWSFGSLHAVRPGEAMTQANAHGTGVATFNDRIRDALRGGNFERSTRSDQGLVTGLYHDFNHDPANVETPVDPELQRRRLLEYTDVVRLGMTGNLADYPLPTASGDVLPGSAVRYRSSPGCGYAADPGECVNYVTAHDNYTLWDLIAAKAPYRTPGRQPATAGTEERARMQMLAFGTIALAQGVRFFHAGVEMLRSRSGDWDSYDSGDWFNRLDFGYRHNNWGVGLPPAEKNRDQWDFWRPRLEDPALRPSPGLIERTVDRFRRFLRMGASTPLLRLRTGADVRARVRFLNAEAGPAQIPGLIVMSIIDGPSPAGAPGPVLLALDPRRRRIVVALNPAPAPVRFQHATLIGAGLRLHPDLAGAPEPWLEELAIDPGSGALTLPARSLVVLEEPR